MASVCSSMVESLQNEWYTDLDNVPAALNGQHVKGDCLREPNDANACGFFAAMMWASATEVLSGFG